MAERGSIRSRWWAAVVLLAAAGACGDDAADPVAAPTSAVIATTTVASATTTAPTTTAATATTAVDAPAPTPEMMCPDGQWPMVAAFALDDGAFRWAACTEVAEMYLLSIASDDVVWVRRLGVDPVMVALDAASGDVVDVPDWDAPDGSDRALSHAPSDGGVSLHGGQDDLLWASDDATHATLWTRDDHPIYDDVWAAGDGAVFLGSAYEIATGEVRWTWTAADGWGLPWHATDDWVLVLGSDLWVLDTDDGSEHWRTHWGPDHSDYPRLFGALANADTVFVSFTMIPSDGD